MMPNWRRSGLLYIAVLLAGVTLATVLFSAPQKPTEIPLSQVITMSQGNRLEKIVEEGEWLTLTTTDGGELKANIGALNYNDLRELGLNADVEYDIKSAGINWGNMLIGFLPLLLFGGLIFFIFFRARGADK